MVKRPWWEHQIVEILGDRFDGQYHQIDPPRVIEGAVEMAGAIEVRPGMLADEQLVKVGRVLFVHVDACMFR